MCICAAHSWQQQQRQQKVMYLCCGQITNVNTSHQININFVSGVLLIHRNSIEKCIEAVIHTHSSAPENIFNFIAFFSIFENSHFERFTCKCTVQCTLNIFSVGDVSFVSWWHNFFFFFLGGKTLRSSYFSSHGYNLSVLIYVDDRFFALVIFSAFFLFLHILRLHSTSWNGCVLFLRPVFAICFHGNVEPFQLSLHFAYISWKCIHFEFGWRQRYTKWCSELKLRCEWCARSFRFPFNW